MGIKKENIRGIRLFSLFIALCLLITIFSGTALASTKVVFTTNGAKNDYVAGSSLLIYGKVVNNGIGVPYTSAFVKAELEDKTIFYGSVLTDENGYFKTGFNIPLSAIVGQTLAISVNNETESFVIKDRDSLFTEEDDFKLLGFTAVGYFEGDTVCEIPASTSQFGIVFSKNVNYFKNNSADDDLMYMGSIENNEDCFTLYKGSSKKAVSVSLLEEGGDAAVVYTNLDGKIANIDAKKVIYVVPKTSLEADTVYRLVIDKGLISNSSVPLGKSIVIYFKTAAEAPTIYTVTFDSKGGSSVSSVSVAEGSTVSKPSNPTKSGYTFAGWYKDAALTQAFDFATAITANTTLYAKWTASSTVSGGGGTTGGDTTPTSGTTGSDPSPSTVTTTISVTAATDNTGKASTSVTQNQVSEAIIKAATDAAAKGSDAKPAIEIKVEAPANAKTVEASIPAAAINQVASSGTQSMTVSSSIAAITFDKETLDGIADKAAGDVNISAGNVDVSTLSTDIQEEIGDHPVFNFSVTSGGSTISSFDGSVTVEVPYALKAGENASNVVIYYINASGQLETVKDCYYDEGTGKVVFKTNHFSQYAVGYNEVSFADVSGWYADYVHYLASRDIIKGSDGKFLPSAKITRAEFAQILANMSGADLSSYTSSSFSDVAGTAWYCKAVAWAYSKGVVQGADGKFNPNASITRQDMALMLGRYTDKIAGTTLAQTVNKVTFADQSSIASYAADSVSIMQQAGIISGRSNNAFDPKANATRAEASKMIALLLQSIIG